MSEETESQRGFRVAVASGDDGGGGSGVVVGAL